MITLHLYRKRIVKGNYYADARPMGVFVDDYHICDMKPGDYFAVYITPGTHKIVVKIPVLILNTMTKEITVDANTTDVYVAFRGLLGKYIYSKMFEPVQYNSAIFSGAPGGMAKVVMHCEDIALKSFIWYSVSVDDQPVGTMDGKNPEMAFTVPKGKHRVAFESYFDFGYACIDVNDDFTYMLVDDCKIVGVHIPQNDPASASKQVKCVLTRTSMVKGCAASTKIRIDTNIDLSLKNGETKSVFITGGRHTIMLKANKVNVKDFIIPDNCSEIDILIDNLDDIKSITAK